MQGFTFWNPTKIVFGKDTVEQVGKQASRFGKKVLMVYGQSSIKKTGVYDLVKKSLEKASLQVVEFAGVKSNPVLSHVRDGVRLAREQQVDLIVAVGGGSVIDESKAIAAGARTDGDVWDFFIDKAIVNDALPIVTVLTLAATASEMNSGGVVTNEETGQKFNIGSPHLFPKVSILDPTLTYTVPANYTAYSGVDAICHLVEGYFTAADPNTPLQDRLVESLVKTVMESTDRILVNPRDYEARATMMWSATLALNGLIPAGIGPFGFPNHMIEHSLSALYDIAHGAGLSIVLPAWMTYTATRAPEKFARFGREIFGIIEPDDQKAAAKGTAALKSWFEHIGSPTTLSAADIPAADISKIAANAVMLAQKWRLDDYTEEIIGEILQLAR
ncbi:iron-containing alcohol dehydrogenase [Desulfuromonas sp. AOP6]|uniref:iron-containing alcohol dehydrogenase n=1 Tax=Desulfuromonas sp. AOP6 TaxID=1566351 RepID=UPI0012793A0D|nr:iron-containing alcohol dehydrogenase [Desulfuromonas sp. AOP6]BCA79327.1 NADH-dependent alcohol dehydrogenase [Desulfuromonas sp. AOP6]